MTRIDISTVNSVLARIEAADYYGFDPADVMNSSILRIDRLPSPIVRLLTLINFYSPVNLRSLLRIRKSQNSTAMALLLQIYSNLSKLTGKNDYLIKGMVVAGWLEEKAHEKDGTIGWVRTIDYQSAGGRHVKNAPLTFIGAQAARGFYRFYEETGERRYLELSLRACDGIHVFPRHIQNGRGICLSYTAQGNEEVVNASAIAAGVLLMVGVKENRQKYVCLAEKLYEYILDVQNMDGSWWYQYQDGHKYKSQIDFHQVYMIESLLQYIRYGKTQLVRVKKAFSSGCDYYLDRQFYNGVYPNFRNQIRYPLDIHNVSHALYIASELAKEYPSFGAIVHRSADLLMLFYDQQGFFYYQKYPGFTVKHEFLRWNNIWSLLAMTSYLQYCSVSES